MKLLADAAWAINQQTMVCHRLRLARLVTMFVDRSTQGREPGTAVRSGVRYATAYPVCGRTFGDLNAKTIRSLGIPADSRSNATPVSVPSRWIQHLPLMRSI